MEPRQSPGDPVHRNIVECPTSCAHEDMEIEMRVPRLTIDLLVAVVALAQRRTMELAVVAVLPMVALLNSMTMLLCGR